MRDDFSFTITSEVVELGVRGAYLSMSGLRNAEHDPEFDSIRERVTGQVLSDLSLDGIKNDPILLGFRALHSAVGRSNRDNVSSPENLLRNLLRHGELPRLNLLVDIYNLVSIESRLALGAHDIDRIDGNVTLGLTTGEEIFHPLGATERKPVHPGQYAYIDDKDEIICRMEVRQVEKSKVGLTTTDCFYIMQGNAATTPAYLERVAARLVELTKRFCGGEERILYISPT